MSGRALYKSLMMQYLYGTISRKDQQQLFDLTRSGLYDNELKAMMDIFLHQPEESNYGLSDEARERLFILIRNSIKQAVSFHKQDSPPRFVRRRAYLALAVLVGLIGFVFWVFFSFKQQIPSENAIKASWAIYSNPSDSNRTILLTDGSNVQLYPGATIQYRTDLEHRMRLLQLEGSGMFDVAPDPERPFFVNGHGISVKVLGTRFTIEERSDAATIAVTVREGKVQVSKVSSDSAKPGRQIQPPILLPNYKAEFNKHTGELKYSLADKIIPIDSPESEGGMAKVHPSLQCNEGILLGDLLRRLQAVYGVNITSSDRALLSSTMMGDFTGQELHDVLEIICLSSDALYAIEGQSIVIKRK